MHVKKKPPRALPCQWGSLDKLERHPNARVFYLLHVEGRGNWWPGRRRREAKEIVRARLARWEHMGQIAAEAKVGPEFKLDHSSPRRGSPNS